jgi:hypothetical protein
MGVIMSSFLVQPGSSQDDGSCDCCGSSQRLDWGLVFWRDRKLASYSVQWVPNHEGHSAESCFVIGPWFEGVPADKRCKIWLQVEPGIAGRMVREEGRNQVTELMLELGYEKRDSMAVDGVAIGLVSAILEQDGRFEGLRQ